jgi:hypothetical protein
MADTLNSFPCSISVGRVDGISVKINLELLVRMTGMEAEFITVNFVHPTNGRRLRVEVDRMMTAGEMLDELIAAEFILRDWRLELACRGRVLRSTDTLKDAGILNEQELVLVPLAEAG